MIPRFIAPKDIQMPSVDGATLLQRDGGPSPFSYAVLGSADPAHIEPLVWRLAFADPNVVTHETLQFADMLGFAPQFQMGWARSMRPGAGTMVSSWGRTVSRSRYMSMSAANKLDREGPFDARTPTSVYTVDKRQTSTTAAAAVFGTWWQHDIIKLAQMLARHANWRDLPAPTFTDWAAARIDPNPQNVMMHNLVPWPVTVPLQMGERVSAKYAARYAQENRRAWAYCFRAIERLKRTASDAVIEGVSVLTLAEDFGLVGPSMQRGTGILESLNEAPSPGQILPDMFFYALPPLPLVFDAVALEGTGRTWPAYGPDSHPLLGFSVPSEVQRETASDLEAVLLNYAPALFDAIHSDHALGVAKSNPGGAVMARGAPSGTRGSGRPPGTTKAVMEARRKLEAAQGQGQAIPAPAEPLPQELQDYFLNPQVRGLAELILLAGTHAEGLAKLYADNPANPPAL